MTPPTPRRADDTKTALLSADTYWWRFCLIILALKFSLLALDPLPKMFMGDSNSYIWTALTGWIPPDRSFLYGYVIRWSSLWTESLTSLLVLQTFLGAITAVLVALVCRWIFNLTSRLSYLFGLLCSLDPLQLVWERYVMAETVSLFFYALMLLFSFLYLKERRFWQLAIVQILSVLVISFRMSYLLVVAMNSFFLPLIAFLPEIRAAFRKHSTLSRMSVARSAGLHLVVSILLMFVLQQGYKQVNGELSGRDPAYLHTTGLSLLTTWAPALKPTDSPDPRLAELIAQGDQFHLNDIRWRDRQLYSPGYLVDRWRQTESNSATVNQVARQTALNALLRRPMGVAALGAKTFLGYCDFSQIHREAKVELGIGRDLPEKFRSKLAVHFRLSLPQRMETKAYTLLQRYFLSAQPYYYVVLLLPFICGGLIFIVSKGYVSLLFLHSWILFGTVTILSKAASVRYLQPMSLLTILIFAAFVKAVIDRRSQSTSTRRDEHLYFARRRSCRQPLASFTTQG